MQISHGPLRLRCSLDDEVFVAAEHLKPGREIACVVGPRLKVRDNAEIGSEKRRAEFGDQLLARPLGAVFRVAGKIAVHAM